MMPRQPNQSLVDGLRVLQFVMMRAEPIGVKMVVDELGMETTRAHRLLRTLVAVGYLRQVKGRKYAPGPAVSILAAQAMQGTGFAKKVLPLLNELQKSTGMLVAYGLLWDRFVTYLYHVEAGNDGGNMFSGHSLSAASDSRLGLAMLAALEETEVRKLYAGHAIPGFLSVDQLLAKLRLINHEGFVYGLTNDRGDHTVAIRFEGNPFASIGIAGQIALSEAPVWSGRLRSLARQIESLQAV